MSEQPVPMTTAAALNAFREELLEGGYSEDQVTHLAIAAMPTLLEGGLGVRRVTA